MCNQQKLSNFGTKPVVAAFNLLKVLAMLGMPFIHVLEMYQAIGVLKTAQVGFTEWVCALTVFGPSVFMLCMGIGMSKNRSGRRLRKTGVQMLLINFVLNLFRFFVPNATAAAIGLMPYLELLSNMLSSDIFFFVGFFYIVYSFAVDRDLSTELLLAASVLMFLINMLLASFVHLQPSLSATLVGHFVSVGSNSYFPLLGWSIYPCLGIFLEKRFFHLCPRKLSMAFASLFAIGGVLFLSAAWLIQGNIVEALHAFAVDSLCTPENSVLIIGITLLTVSGFYFLYQLVGDNPVDRWLSSLAPLVFPFYILQWLGTALVTSYAVAIYMMITGEFFQIGSIGYLGIAAVVDASSLFITYQKGFSLSRWLLRVSDYTRWVKKPKKE